MPEETSADSGRTAASRTRDARHPALAAELPRGSSYRRRQDRALPSTNGHLLLGARRPMRRDGADQRQPYRGDESRSEARVAASTSLFKM